MKAPWFEQESKDLQQQMAIALPHTDPSGFVCEQTTDLLYLPAGVLEVSEVLGQQEGALVLV